MARRHPELLLWRSNFMGITSLLPIFMGKVITDQLQILRWKTSEVRKKWAFHSPSGDFSLKDFFSTNFSHLNQIEKWPLREVSFCHWTPRKISFFLDLFLSKDITLSLPCKREYFHPLIAIIFTADENDRNVHPTCGISKLVIHFG